MPDQDIYNRHIPKNWQTAARIAFTSRDDELVTQTLLRALGKEVKLGGCPGIDEIAATVADFVSSPDAPTHDAISRRLERISRRYGNERTAIAQEAARKFLLDTASVHSGTTLALSKGQVSLAISKAFLIELAISKISSPKLAASLLENGELSTYQYVQRQHHVGHLLATSPVIELLAHRLLEAPEGQGIKTPRVTITKLTPEEAASYQLTS